MNIYAARIGRTLISSCIGFAFCLSAEAQPVITGLVKRPMTNAVIDDQGKLNVMASATSSSVDFNFLSGKYNMHNKRLKSRLNNSTEWIEYEATDENSGSIVNGMGNLDILKTNYNLVDGKPYEGLTVRLFDPKTRLWRLYWIDHTTGVIDEPVVGSFEGNVGTFYAKDSLRGKPILVEFRWDKTDPENPVWSQSFSPDNGITWEMNFTNVSHHVK